MLRKIVAQHMKIVSAEFVKGIRGTDDITTAERPQVAFVGRSNVGKSSLINALTGRKGLARASDKPGRTSEINFFEINRKLYLVDLPGYGFATGSIKDREKFRKLIVWYLSESGAKPVCVTLVIDAVAGLTAFDEDMLSVLKSESHPHIIVINKIDKLTQKELHARVSEVQAAVGDTLVLLCSTKEGTGIRELNAYIFGE